MKIAEIWHGPEVTKVRWATGENIEKASLLSREEQRDRNNAVVWVEIDRLFINTSPAVRQAKDKGLSDEIDATKQHWFDGGWSDPASLDVFNNLVHFVEGRHRIVAARDQGALFAPVIVPKENLSALKQLLGGGTVSSREPLAEIDRP